MLTDAEEEAYKEIFAVMDVDSSGTIGLSELQSFLSELPNPPSPAQVGEIFEQCDADGSGEIDSDEFIDVVETIKLLQNKTTEQIIATFKSAKAADVFHAADPARLGYIDAGEASTLCALLTTPNAAQDALQRALATVPAATGQPAGTVSLEQFCASAAAATAQLRVTVAVEALRGAQADAQARAKERAMLEQRLAEEVESDGGDDDAGGRSMGRHDTSTLQQLRLEKQLGEAKLQVTALEAAQQQTAARCGELESDRDALQKENKDLIYENEKLRRKLKSSRAAVGVSEDTGAELKRLLDIKAREAAELQHSYELRLDEKDADITRLTAESDALRQQVLKQKQEAGRRSAALALLHKHVGELEQQNDALRKEMGGVDSERAKDQAAREIVLKQMLAEANKTLEDLQQDIWFRDRQAYLRGEAPKARSPSWQPAEKWQTDPHLKQRAAAGERVALSTQAESIAPESACGSRRRASSRSDAGQPQETDPTDGEYEVLAAYYHQYQETPSHAILDMCARALDSVNTHHPAYWTVGDFRRIRSWMAFPQLSPSLMRRGAKRSPAPRHRQRPSSAQRSAASASPQPTPPPPPYQAAAAPRSSPGWP
eukprot:TRINITY_DN19688_c0_g1_i1.p1 TRINITY_DN19688_c0_g1~~TRINITY_DN19688_c0_g1_i1.p1  ORF type:complete len:626 (+),score=251.09 TRINITY_DN19688_c0_g1_i1:73-1878(+)